MDKNSKRISIKNVDYATPASQRGIDMLLAKYHKKNFETEVPARPFQQTLMPNLKEELGKAKIALVTDGGLVPKGNPDNLNPTNSQKFCMYSLGDSEMLLSRDYEVSHQGYNTEYIEQDPNRLLPIDAMRRAQREGLIGWLFDIFYTTAGVMTSVENGTALGEKIAVSLKNCGVDAVILSSTCGTSTRCGALIGKEIERLGIPVVQVTNLTKIAESVGVSRILRGNDICHVFGAPQLSLQEERTYRWHMVRKALNLLEAEIESSYTDSIVSE